MDDKTKSLLITLAAEMVRGVNMPLEFVEDWNLPKSTPMKARREISAASQIASAQCRDWANRIRKIVDSAKEPSNGRH